MLIVAVRWAKSKRGVGPHKIIVQNYVVSNDFAGSAFLKGYCIVSG